MSEIRRKIDGLKWHEALILLIGAAFIWVLINPFTWIIAILLLILWKV